MSSFVDQYIINITRIQNNTASQEVGIYAQNLYELVNKLIQGEITAEEFNSIGQLAINDSDSIEIVQEKRSLNYIKDRIHKANTGYYEKAKYEIPDEVKMNREELVKLYGANKKFYAYNGIMERVDIEKVVNIQFGLQYYQGITIIAVDSSISAENFIELV